MYDKCSIFVGNLAIFCTERDIEEAFSPFGQILSISIKCDEETNKNLSYGFVKYSSEVSAHQAMKALNGKILCGRPLRIGKALKEKIKDKQLFPKTLDLETSSIHVTYISYQTEKLVTEESLRAIFSSFGDVIDASIKKSTVDQIGNCQSGYGFVHYSSFPDGVESAFMAARSLYDVQIDSINYICKISHALENHLKSHSFASGHNFVDSYNGAHKVGHLGRSLPSQTFAVSNASAFGQYLPKDMPLSAAHGVLNRTPLASHEDRRSLPMHTNHTFNSFENRSNQLMPQEMPIPYHYNNKLTTINKRGIQLRLSKPQQQHASALSHYRGPSNPHPNPKLATSITYPQRAGPFNQTGMPFQPHFSSMMSEGEKFHANRLPVPEYPTAFNNSPSCEQRHYRSNDSVFRGEGHFQLDENRRPFRPTDSYVFQESTSGRSSTTNDSFLSLNDEMLPPKPPSFSLQLQLPLPPALPENNSKNSSAASGDSKRSRDPFFQFHYCDPNAFEDEPSTMPWHANSFSWSQNFLSSAQEYQQNHAYHGSQRVSNVLN